jgi:IS30 family transposase
VVMGKNYKQLNMEDRVMIGILKAGGKSLREIALELGRSHSTISREMKRNASLVESGKYLPLKADERAYARKREAGGSVSVLRATRFAAVLRET